MGCDIIVLLGFFGNLGNLVYMVLPLSEWYPVRLKQPVVYLANYYVHIVQVYPV